jgi:ubiquinol-cytochrome c reductase cytochrome c subunit
MIRRLTIFLAAMLCAMGAFAQDTPRGNAASGKELFEAKGCYSCHGYVGQGSREGPRLTPPTAYAAFVLQLREPRAIMPPYKAELVSDREVADIYAYLAALPKPPDPKTVPLLR